MRLQQGHILLTAPSASPAAWIEHFLPAIAALFAASSGDEGAHLNPRPPEYIYSSPQLLVFLLSPGTASMQWIKAASVPVLALSGGGVFGDVSCD